RHTVGGQVPGHDVDQAGHGGGAGEPQDQDGTDVVRGAERLTQVLVGQVRQGATVGLAAGGELGGGYQDGGDEAGGDQVHRHDQRGGGEQLAGVADTRAHPFLRVGAAGGDQRHHAHPGLEAGQPQHQQGQRQYGRADD